MSTIRIADPQLEAEQQTPPPVQGASSGGGTGTVTYVNVTVPAALLTATGGPITGSGTIATSLATQSPNTVLAGPGSGSVAAVPAFRALVPADVAAANQALSNLTSPTAINQHLIPDGTTRFIGTSQTPWGYIVTSQHTAYIIAADNGANVMFMYYDDNTQAVHMDVPQGQNRVSFGIAGVTAEDGLRTPQYYSKEMAGGADASGTGSMTAGSVTITTSAATTTSRIFLSLTSLSAHTGTIAVTAKANGHFDVTSSNVLDDNTFDWIVIRTY